MARNAEKLFEQMRLSKSNWNRRDLDSLYEGYGFVIVHGAHHDIVKHPIYPQLRATLGRHNELATGYISSAVKLVSQLLELEKAEEQKRGQ